VLTALCQEGAARKDRVMRLQAERNLSAFVFLGPRSAEPVLELAQGKTRGLRLPLDDETGKALRRRPPFARRTRSPAPR